MDKAVINLQKESGGIVTQLTSKSTAWYIERLNYPSSGKAVPQEVLDKRAEARVLINELEV